MKYVQLSMIVGNRHPANEPDFSGDADGGDGGDGLGHASIDAGGALVPAGGEQPQAAQPTDETTPVMIDLHEVRNFYPRKPDAMGNPRVGTRLTFKGAGAGGRAPGMAVSESFDEVKRLLTEG